MKKVLAALVMAMQLAGTTQAAELDLNAPVMQEVYYCMFERRLRMEVEQAFIDNGVDPHEAEITVAYLKAQIDMPVIKEKTMACFREHGLGFMQKEERLEEMGTCLQDYKDQLLLYNQMAHDNSGLKEEAIAAAYFVAPEEKAEGTDEERLTTMLTNIAANLALSRMNVRGEYQKMLQCMREGTISPAERLDKIPQCTGEAAKVYDAAMRQAMDDLMPFADFFALIIYQMGGQMPEMAGN